MEIRDGEGGRGKERKGMEGKAGKDRTGMKAVEGRKGWDMAGKATQFGPPFPKF